MPHSPESHPNGKRFPPLRKMYQASGSLHIQPSRGPAKCARLIDRTSKEHQTPSRVRYETMERPLETELGTLNGCDHPLGRYSGRYCHASPILGDVVDDGDPSSPGLTRLVPDQNSPDPIVRSPLSTKTGSNFFHVRSP